MSTVVNWLKAHWFILSALATAGVAWGQNTTKVNELQTRLDKAEAIVSQQNRIDERTVIMQQELKDQRAILLEMLTNQRMLVEKTNAIKQRVIPVEKK